MRVTRFDSLAGVCGCVCVRERKTWKERWAGRKGERWAWRKGERRKARDVTLP